MNSRLVLKVQEFCRQHWRQVLRWREKLQFREEALHLAMAGGVGVIGGLVNLFFFYAIENVKLLVLRGPGDPVEVAEEMAAWQRVLIPTLGGLVAGLVLHWGQRLVGRQGSSNLLEVVVAGDGKLPFRTNLVKAASSLVSIGTGASIGREGAITQLSATLASKLGQIAKWPPYRLRLLVGCGAASAIAVVYHAGRHCRHAGRGFSEGHSPQRNPFRPEAVANLLKTGAQRPDRRVDCRRFSGCLGQRIRGHESHPAR
jgi:CIC family chloride channel protein